MRISPLAVTWVCARALAQGSVSGVGPSLTPRSDPETPANGSVSGRLLNLSTIAHAGAADVNPLIAGFALTGAAPRQILIRAVGPTLALFGVSGSLTALRLDLFRGTTLLGTNSAWENGDVTSSSLVRSASQRVGAFALPSGSKDAALLITLPSDYYTAQVSGAGRTSGLALLEVYDVS